MPLLVPCPSCIPGDPCGAARASRPHRRWLQARPALPLACDGEANSQRLRPSYTVSPHKRAGRARLRRTGRAAGSTAGQGHRIQASGYRHLTRSRPQDSASNAAAPRQEPRKPLGGQESPAETGGSSGARVWGKIGVRPVLGHPRASTFQISHASGFCTKKGPSAKPGPVATDYLRVRPKSL